MHLTEIRAELDELTAVARRTDEENLRRNKLISAYRFLSEVCPKLSRMSDRFSNVKATELELDQTAGFLDRNGIDGHFTHKDKDISTSYASRTLLVNNKRCQPEDRFPVGGITLRLARKSKYWNTSKQIICNLEVMRLVDASAYLPGEIVRPGYHIFSWFAVTEGVEPREPGSEECVNFCCISETSLVSLVTRIFNEEQILSSRQVNFFGSISRLNNGMLAASAEEVDKLESALLQLDIVVREWSDDGTKFLCLPPDVVRRHCSEGEITTWTRFSQNVFRPGALLKGLHRSY